MKNILIVGLTTALTLGIVLTSCQKQKDYSGDINALKSEISALQKSTDSLAAALAATNQNLGNLADTVNSIKNQLLTITNEISVLNTELLSANANIASIQAELAALTAQYQALLAELNAILAQLNLAPASLSNGLVAYYPFTGNAGDSSGNGNDGTVYGANLTTDRFGNANSAYGFNGVSNYIEIANPNLMSHLSNAQILSVSFWAIDNAAPPIVHCVMGTWSLPNGGLYINDYLGNGFAVAIIPNSLVFYETLPIDGNYHHFVVIFDGTQTTNSSKLRVYRDGSLQSLNFPYSVPSTLGPGSSSLLIGARWGNPNALQTDFWNGKIDDIRIYNRALCQSEVTYLATH